MDQATFRKMKFLFEPVDKIEDLDRWFQYFLGVEFPWDTVDPESTSSPLKALWSVYHFMLTGTGQSTHIVAASRNSFKTLISAGIHCYSMLQFRRDDAHTAATLNQSSAATRYLGQFYSKIGQKLDLTDYVKVNNFRTFELHNLPATDFATRTTARSKIVTATLKGANSDRASCLIFDELDLTPQPIIDEAVWVADPSIPRGDHFQLPPAFIYLSSRKTNTGPVQRIMERASQSPEEDKLHKWSTSDMMRSCPPEVHRPEEPRTMAYINTSTLETIWGEENFHQNVAATAQSEWKSINAYAGCKGCKVWIPCLSNSVNQRGDAPTLRTREFVYGTHRNVSDPSYIIGQSLNWRPETKGLVYQQFNRVKHLLPGLVFFEWATGKSYCPDGMSPEEYFEKWDNAETDTELALLMPSKIECYRAMLKVGWEFNIGVDWGSRDPATANVVGFHPKLNRACVLHYEQTPMANHLWAEYVENNIANVFVPEFICPDMADASSASYFKRNSCFVEKYHIEPGVSFIRGLLWNPIKGTYDFAIYDDFLSNKENNNWHAVNAMEKWSHHRKPDGTPDLSKFSDDEFCHFNDSLRYGLAPYIKRMKGVMSVDQSPNLLHNSRFALSPEEVELIKQKQKMDSHLREHIMQISGVDTKEPVSKPEGKKQGSLKFKF